MIIGNGEIGETGAAAIAAADFVIRFNECRSFVVSPGRTDVVAVCNTGRPAKAMLGSDAWRSHPAVTEASEIWSVRDPEKFAALRVPLAVSHPELGDFCDDYTSQFNAFCAEAGKQHVVVEKVIHEAVDKALATFDPAPYVVPSSGMIAIAETFSRFPKSEIGLAGFSHTGWEWHPFAAERQLVDSYIADGRLTRYAAEPSLSSSQGA
ncbi:Urease operon accessory protein [Rhizobium sullae]|uniref:Urease operon accessory protein n=1 Tax=Rhizobium sullae TaxID=50338 RepID=A0A2N0D629_RHISU|nr:Urease operon accessory protein [Rhizobium sullae]PKA41563.1 Urease operon accessory protein [Rhizobium sullae]